MDKDKLRETISNILRLSNKKIGEERIDRLVEELIGFSNKDIIDSLSLKVLSFYGKDNSKLLESLELIRGLDPSVYKDWKGMLKVAEINKATNHKPGDLSVKENHALIDKTLVEVCNRLNALRVDYYVVGALSSFIGTNTPLFRYHDDIDFMVAEEDLDKVSKALEGTDFVFEDNRLHNKKTHKEGENHTGGEHEVIANHKENEFHLGFFLFKRNPDNSLTIREYYMEDGEPHVLERHLPKELVDLEYTKKTTEYKGTRFRTSTPESVLAKKEYTRHGKDLLDIEALRDKVDRSKIAEARQYRTPFTTKPVNEKKNNSELSSMVEKPPVKQEETKKPQEKATQKSLGVHPATQPSSNKPSGFITAAASLLIVILIMTIVLLIMAAVLTII